jgi:UDP-GlcNAc3NAcA epimerase
LTDRISTLLLCPTQTAVDNLHREGFPFPTPRRGKQRIEQVGDVMYDAVLHYRDHARERISLDTWGLEDQSYALCTLHRQENTDDPARLSAILAALRDIARELPVVLPLHPRTRQKLEQQGALAMLDRLRIVDPLPYLEMQRLQMSARLILTDSGGMQKEAYFHGVPCITLRDETEWMETIDAGWNQLTGANQTKIVGAFRAARAGVQSQAHFPYGDGCAARQILARLV